MTLHPQSVKPIPALTKEIARQAFFKDNLYMMMRDRLGTFYTDWDFANLFPSQGQPATCPWRLALITVMQFVEGLTDRQAANASNVEVLPTTIATPPPTKSDLGSRFKDIGWRDGVEKGIEMLIEASDLMPVVGLAIKTGANALLGLGEYSPDERLKNIQFKWAVEEIVKISHKIDILIQKLPPDEQIEAADVAAIINAAMKASEKTADAKKRKLLKNAVVNAFDIEQYQQGMTLRLFKILEQVEYGDVVILRQIMEKTQNITHNQVNIKSFLEDESFGIRSLKIHHVEILEECSLIKIWSRLPNEPLGVGGQGYIQVAELGEKFLEFIKDAQ